MKRAEGITLVELLVALGVSVFLLVSLAAAASGFMEAAARAARSSASSRLLASVLCWTFEESWRIGPGVEHEGRWVSSRKDDGFELRLAGAAPGEGVLARGLDSCALTALPLEGGGSGFLRLDLSADRPELELDAVLLLFYREDTADAP